MISLVLANFPVTLGIGRALLGIAMDEYKVEGMKQDDGYFSFFFSSSSNSTTSPAPTTTASSTPAPLPAPSPSSTPSSTTSPQPAPVSNPPKNQLVHPEALHALFELIKFADDESMYIT